MARRLALVLALLAALAPAAWRRLAPAPGPRRPCEPEGRGVPPLGWIGCTADPGPRRALADSERLALGLPLDPNTAPADALAAVPGLGRSLARSIVADREAHGPYASVDALARVRGIGPVRLARARAALALAPPVPPALRVAPAPDAR